MCAEPIIMRPHQVDFLFHGPAGPKNVEFQKKKKKVILKKGRKAHVINMWSISATVVSFIMLHNNGDGVISRI